MRIKVAADVVNVHFIQKLCVNYNEQTNQVCVFKLECCHGKYIQMLTSNT